MIDRVKEASLAFLPLQLDSKEFQGLTSGFGKLLGRAVDEECANLSIK